MVVDRALGELRIPGVFGEHVVEEYPTIVSLVEEALDHGHRHPSQAA